MSDEWILRTIVDLRDFAELNDLPLTAEKADQLLAQAREEIEARVSRQGTVTPPDHDTPTGRVN